MVTAWSIVARLNATLEREQLPLLASLTEEGETQETQILPGTPAEGDAGSGPDQPRTKRMNQESRSLHRLRSEVTQLRQQERALREAVQMMKTGQSPRGPLSDESHRLQIEIARLEEIERNLAAKAPGEESTSQPVPPDP